MLVEMRRVDVVAPRSKDRTLLRCLHRAGTVHLMPFAVRPGAGEVVFRSGSDRAELARLETARERVGELAHLLGESVASPTVVAELWELDDDALLHEVARLDPIRERASGLAAERVRLLAEQGRTEGYRVLVEGLRAIADRLPALRGFASTAIVLQPRYRYLVGVLRDELEGLTAGRCELIAADLEGGRVGAALLYPTKVADRVEALLGGRDLEKLPLPAEFVGLPFRELEPRLGAAVRRLGERISTIDTEMADLGRAHGAQVAAFAAVFADRAAERAALREAGASDHLVVVSGWIPAARLADLRSSIAQEVGTDVLVLDSPLTHRESDAAPVAFENRTLLRPFERLASFVSVPRYGSIDPTPYLAVTLPIFIGLMVGDIGYGLVLLGLLFLARRRWPRSSLLSGALPIALLAAGSTIVFGFLFGEAFGDLGARALGLRPIWLDRATAAIDFLVLAIAIGAAQVGFGLVLGVVNGILVGDRHEAVGRAATLSALAAIAVLLGWLAGPLPASLGYLAAAGLVTALAVLIATLGMTGPIELIGAVGNILSYARLMAIGLASVMLAIVANELGSLPHNVFVGAIVALLLHSLNVALGFFDSSIQGLRLHYVEFFGKFVEPGGVRFAPFRSALGGP